MHVHNIILIWFYAKLTIKMAQDMLEGPNVVCGNYSYFQAGVSILGFILYL